MSDGTPRVQVQLLDPVPGVVVAKVLDGLRALGLDAELLGNAAASRAPTGARPRLCLACGRPAAESADAGSAVVTIPATVPNTRFDRSMADRVMEDVLRVLGGLAPGL